MKSIQDVRVPPPPSLTIYNYYEQWILYSNYNYYDVICLRQVFLLFCNLQHTLSYLNYFNTNMRVIVYSLNANNNNNNYSFHYINAFNAAVKTVDTIIIIIIITLARLYYY